MLATGATQAEAGEECGVSERTIARWVSDPEFSAQVESSADNMHRAVQARLKSLAGAAIETVANVMLRGIEPKDRIAAARIILDRVAPIKQDMHVTTKLETMSTEELKAEMERQIQAMGYVKRVDES